MAGIGPAPFAAMVLSDLGAEGLRVENVRAYPGSGDQTLFPLHRGRDSVVVDLKSADGPETVLRLLQQADILLEGFRPGVMERLGVGPDVALERNPRLVYGRMTGWGQDGPLAGAAGHDIDYIAIAGALRHFARAGEKPVPPINMVGDFGGGGMLLVVGVLAGLTSARATGHGQVVDVAMADGAALLMTMIHSFVAQGAWGPEPGTNTLDTGAHFYDVYETSDGGYMAVGAVEAQFYSLVLAGLGLADEELPDQLDASSWPGMRERFAAVFRTRTRDEWTAVFDGTDACVAPVLHMAEAPGHPQMAARGTFLHQDGVLQPAPAPRFLGTPVGEPRRASAHGADTREALQRWGFSDNEIVRLAAAGTLGQAVGAQDVTA
jgi:alpha-methylacyl-CoA racemase